MAVVPEESASQSMYFSPAFSSGSRILYMSSPSTPAASLARFSPSFASRAAAASSVLPPSRARHDDDAVVVGHDHVARVHQRAGADHGDVDRAERGLDGALGADGPAPHGKSHLGQRLHVAAAGVDDQGARAARLEASGQQVAEEAVGAVGRARGDDDVAGLDLLGHHVHHPVVAGLQQHRDRRARHLRAGVDRPHVGLHEAHATHGFVDGGRTEFRQPVGRRAVGPLDVSIDNSEFVHDHSPLLFRRASSRGNTRRALAS